jgi:hypothetical protein
MRSIWVESINRSFDQALDLLTAAVRDCTPALWETSMWEVAAPAPDRDLTGPDGKLVTDPAERLRLVQRWSTPWGVAWHALEVLDYDLNGSSSDWAPPPPFAGHPHWRDLTSLPVAWSQSEVLAYVEHCRQQVREALADMTEEKAATRLPPAHRYQGQPHAWVIASLVGHTTEHASQIRQFVTAAGTALDS